MSRDTAALLRAFKACGVTRAEIAKRAGVSQSLVSMASGGRPHMGPRAEKAVRIACVSIARDLAAAVLQAEGGFHE